MKKLLFPTDFSETANNAFIYALNLANELRAELYVLNTYVLPMLSATHAGHPELVSQVYENYELNSFEHYKANVAKLRVICEEQNITTVPLFFLFENGTVTGNVVKIVESEQIDLIIMGTNGASGLAKSIIGTNTVSVIKSVKIPVLSVPIHAHFKGLKEIVFTTLFREKDESALKEILAIASLFGAQVKCVHVLKNKNVDIIMLIEDWENRFSNANLEFVILDFVESVEKSINTYITDNQIDVLCVVKRNRTFFDRLFASSISNNLSFHANTPTLVFHEDQ